MVNEKWGMRNEEMTASKVSLPSFLISLFSFLILFSSCSEENNSVDKLNSLSYASHYRDIDSTEYYAHEAMRQSACRNDQRAEALNNLAFCMMARMDYARADSLLREAEAVTDNQIELLVAEVQQMRLCQRRSQNRAFYEHRERAVSHLQRIREERDLLSSRQRQRLVYAESEMAIVNSTYYYYVGLERQSVEALQALNTEEVRRDTAQYLNYLYNVGSGGILTEGTPEEMRQEEMDYLTRCLKIARHHRYPYFEAQALEALAEHSDDVAMAEEALRLFACYGDVYQIAGAHRTVASCYHVMGDYRHALEQLHQALSDQRVQQAPDLVASIREQLSVAYAGINDKVQSDQNRTIYIDLQEQTRQDRELEARAGILDRAVSQLNWMMLAVVVAIVMLAGLLWLFNYLNRRNKYSHQLDDLLEQKNEAVAEARLRVERNERRHLEQRAKVSLAMGILPLIDRILYTIDHSPLTGNAQHSPSGARLDYIRELTDNINEQNELLTRWIQLRQGELSLHVESFPLQPLFDIVARSQTGFRMKGLQLTVSPTDAVVKADRVLTLFMLNTLADNARKFTPQGGEVTISAEETDHYVEVSVRDTGCGMSEEQLAHVFDIKPIRDEGHGTQRPAPAVPRQSSHGFGLMNCRGIIEKYRKTSQLFSVCRLSAESEQGRGSRFFFRLPKGVLRGVVIAVASSLLATTAAAADRHPSPLDRAQSYADSAYSANRRGDYGRTLRYADSCRDCLNEHYRARHPEGRLLMTRQGDQSVTPAEIVWFHERFDTDYQLILDLRNESAVAALALHEWSLYVYNNKVYTQLFKEMSADTTLADYCRTMQQSQQNKRIAVILLLVLLASLVPAYYLMYYRPRLYRRFRREHQLLEHIELAEDELRRSELENGNLHVANAVLDNCLSTLKHETMYYPSRIRQLVDTGQLDSLAEVARYYRDLYGMLIGQAIAQVERIPLHVRPVMFYGQPVLGDENLLHYLFELLSAERSKGGAANDVIQGEPRDDKYVVYHIALAAPVSPISSLLCRQIVRDHGEATNRRGCGITIDGQQVTITLPRYNGKL